MTVLWHKDFRADPTAIPATTAGSWNQENFSYNSTDGQRVVISIGDRWGGGRRTRFHAAAGAGGVDLGVATQDEVFLSWRQTYPTAGEMMTSGTNTNGDTKHGFGLGGLPDAEGDGYTADGVNKMQAGDTWSIRMQGRVVRDSYYGVAPGGPFVECYAYVYQAHGETWGTHTRTADYGMHRELREGLSGPVWNPTPGVEYKMTLYVKRNTAGAADGIIRVYVDGALSLEWTDVRLTQDDTIPVNQLMNEVFTNGTSDGEVWSTKEVWLHTARTDEPADSSDAVDDIPRTGLSWPFSVPVTYVDGWDELRDGGTRLHRATDVYQADGGTGSAVYAAEGGTVDAWMPGVSHPEIGDGGYTVRIDTDDGELRWVYSHFGDETDGVSSAYAVSPGDTVAAGQLIGWLGTSGTTASGPHVHVEMRDLVGTVNDPDAPAPTNYGFEDGPRYNPYPTLRRIEADPESLTATVVTGGVDLTCAPSDTVGVEFYWWFRRRPATGARFDPAVDTPIATTAGRSYSDPDGVAGDDYQVFGAATGTATAGPVASFTTSATSAETGETVTFDGSGSTGTGLSYNWDDAGALTEPFPWSFNTYPIGDQTSAVQTVAFNNAGTKYVRLTVTDTEARTDAHIVEFVVTDPASVETFGDGSPVVQGTSTTSGGDPDPIAYADLGTAMAEPGGQTVVVADGTYTVGNDVGHTHTDWLIIKAETAGGVTITGPFEPRGCSRIMFVGFNFTDSGVRAGYYQSGDENDRIVFWYCEASAPLGAGLSTGLHTHREAHYAIAGCDVHRCEHDGLKVYSDETIVVGTRVWDIEETEAGDPNQYHTDSVQAENGLNQLYEYCTMGLAPDGTDAGDGHVQLMRDHSSTWRHCWLANSSSVGMMADNYEPGAQTTVVIDDVRIWGNNSYPETGTGVESDYAIGTANGATITEEGAGLLTGAPPVGETPPDVVWRTANPYSTYATWLAGLSWV